MNIQKYIDKRYTAVYILAGSFILAILMILAKPSTSKIPLQERAWHVNTVVAKIQANKPTLILHGVTESPRLAHLEASIVANVIDTPVLEGQYVKQGDLLIKLDERDIQLLIEQRIAEVANLTAQIKMEQNRYKTDKLLLKQQERLVALNERDLDRAEKLVKKRASSQAAMDEIEKKFVVQAIAKARLDLNIENHLNRLAQLKAQLKRATALLEKTKLDLKRTNLTAPFNGLITKLHTAIGNRAQIGETLISIYDTDKIEVRAQIPTDYIHTIKTALHKQQTINADIQFNGKIIKLNLNRLASLIVKGRGGNDAIFQIKQPTEPIAIGRAGKLKLTLPAVSNSIKIPVTALHNQNTIYLVKNSRLVGIKVNRLGIIHEKDQNYYVIKSNYIKNGDRIVTTPLQNARSGLLVVSKE